MRALSIDTINNMVKSSQEDVTFSSLFEVIGPTDEFSQKIMKFPIFGHLGNIFRAKIRPLRISLKNSQIKCIDTQSHDLVGP